MFCRVWSVDIQPRGLSPCHWISGIPRPIWSLSEPARLLLLAGLSCVAGPATDWGHSFVQNTGVFIFRLCRGRMPCVSAVWVRQDCCLNTGFASRLPCCVCTMGANPPIRQVSAIYRGKCLCAPWSLCTLSTGLFTGGVRVL